MILLRSLACAAVIIIIIATYSLCKGKFLKNKFYLAYEADPIIRVDETYKKYKNIVYKPNKFVSKYIDAYALSFGKKNTVMFSYTDNMDQIAYYVVVYNRYHEPIKLIYIKDTRGLNHSSVVKLPKKAVDINIVIKSVANETLNPCPIVPVSNLKLLVYSFHWTLILIGLIVLSYTACVEIFATGFKESYVSKYIWIAAFYLSVCSVVFMLILFFILKLRNLKPKIREVNKYAV